MPEQQETYRGRKIVVRSGTSDDAVQALDSAVRAAAGQELLIDGQPIFTVQNSSGQYIASGLAYAPRDTLMELAKQIVDSKPGVQ